MRTQRGTRGFTLLELLMVVIIIAILASIALPQYIRATEKMRATEPLQILGALRGAQNRYRAQSPTNVYTATATDLDFDWPVPLSAQWGTITMNVSRAYFPRSAGQYVGQVVGIFYTNGTICANFAPMGLAACP